MIKLPMKTFLSSASALLKELNPWLRRAEIALRGYMAIRAYRITHSREVLQAKDYKSRVCAKCIFLSKFMCPTYAHIADGGDYQRFLSGHCFAFNCNVEDKSLAWAERHIHIFNSIADHHKLGG